MDTSLICKISIPNTYAHAYDYQRHADLPAIGTRVLVPFKKRERIGVIIDYAAPDKVRQLKEVLRVIDEQPLFSQEYMAWLKWIANYYHVPFSEILALAMPKTLREEVLPHEPPKITFLKLIASQLSIPKQQKKILQLQRFLQQQGQALSIEQLKHEGFSKATLTKAVAMQVAEYEYREDIVSFTASANSVSLNLEQQQAVAAIDSGLFKPYLLQGVTGSGKTEVYIELIKKTLQQGKQALLLIPEIGLTSGINHRLKTRLDTHIVVFHSHLSEKQRFKNWQQAYFGHAGLVLGTRSAIFAPLPNLGLIIIDEEHDLSFKQQDGVRYSAKDSLIMRAKMQNIAIILGTATPALESFYNAQHHRYKLVLLTKKALNDTPLSFSLVDLRQKKTLHGVADDTLQYIKKHLALHQQVLVFINRRGYAPLLFCHDCGSAVGCKRCDVNLTLYRAKNYLTCHHCGWGQKPPKQCIKCSSAHLVPVGCGTEQVADYLTLCFPEAKVLRFDRDVMKNKVEIEKGLLSIQNKEINIIVATQMLAKGHHFANLNLVVILDGDSGFYQSDFRALERLGQMITQVAGRAGRADKPGEVIIQTHLPKHPLLLTLIQQGYEPFITQLLKQREEAQLPPYNYLALVRVQGKNATNVISCIKLLAQSIADYPIEVLGPAPAPIEKKAEVHRWQLVLKAWKRHDLHSSLEQISAWLGKHCLGSTRWFIEVDPYDLSS